MAWISGYSAPTEPIVDWNAKFKAELKGELDDETAEKTLGKFLIHNIGFTTFLLTGYILEAYQRIMIKSWFKRNNTLTVAGRGVSKSFCAAHFAYLQAIFEPNTHILVVSMNFRSSRSLLEAIDGWSRKRKGTYLRQCIATDMTKRQDLYRITFINGSTITAVPLGDPNNLRGFRCNTLIIDEGLLISERTMEMVLKPFLMGGSDVTRKQKIRRWEDRQIKEGRMKEEDRMVFKSKSKMIVLSSASYVWEDLYKLYKKYLGVIYNKEKADMEDEVSTYCVHQLSYTVAKYELIDESIRKELEGGMIPEVIKKREYGAQFTLESGGYFDAKKMEECTVPPGERPCIEIVGEKGAEYVLAIDPNVSADLAADHFAMCLLKIVEKRNKEGVVTRKVGMMVHGYAEAGGYSIDKHMLYLLYLIDNFNIVYIAVDATQGDQADFISICNESELFKRRHIKLSPIQAEFGRDNFDLIAKDVNKSYNRHERVIVQKQSFSGPYIRAANEYLKSCFDFNNIFFASKASALPDAMQSMSSANIDNIHQKHPAFSDKEGEGSVYEFINHQDFIIDLTKRECSFVNPTSTAMGHITFDLPSNMKRTKDPKRNRRDSYTALVLANWALKVYVSSQELPKEEEETDLPPPALL